MNKPLPRVLEVWQGKMAKGGTEEIVLAYQKNLQSEVAFTYLIPIWGKRGIWQNPYDDNICDYGGKTIIFEYRLRDFFSLSFYRKLKKIISDEEYDAIHYHANSPYYPFALAVLWISGISGVKKRLIQAHTNLPYTGSCLTPFMHHFLRLFISTQWTQYLACSEAAGEMMFGRKKFTVLKNGIETKRFCFSMEKREHIRQKLGIPEDGFMIGTVGRMDKNKNQTFLLDVFNELLKVCPNAWLLLVGDGEKRVELEDKSKTLGLSTRVLFTGMSSDPSVFYSAMDIFVLSSKIEGLGIVGIEAQCNGLACLFSDAVPEIAVLIHGVKRLPLELGASMWCDALMELKDEKRDDRTRYAEEVKARGWDISQIVTPIKEFYTN